MPDFGLGVLVLVIGSAAVGAGRKLLERRRAHSELLARPVLDTGAAEGTVVRVTGVVRALDRTLEAPLSGARCVVVRSRVTAGGSRITRQALVPRESFAMVPFIIERPEGNVSIEGEHALLDLPPVKLPALRNLTSPERSRRELFLRSQGLRTDRRALFAETIVEPGMTVSIAGLMMKDLAADAIEPVIAPGAGERGFRDAPPTSLRLAGNADHPLVIGEPVDRALLA